MGMVAIIKRKMKREDRGDPVYIVHSMPKTGTTSLARAICLLGLSRQPHGWKPALGKKYRVEIDAANKLLLPFSQLNQVPAEVCSAVSLLLRRLKEELDGENLFSDFPVGHVRLSPLAKKIMFPKSKFIWVDRELDSWVKSIYNWEKSHPEVFVNFEKRWADYQGRSDAFVSNYESEKERLKCLWQEFPQDVLFLSIDDGWEPLCKFLGVDEPDVQYPHRNAS